MGDMNLEWHHIITKPPTCLFGQAIDNYVKFPLAKLVKKQDGSWDWIVFERNISGNEPDRTSARIAADKIMNQVKNKCPKCGGSLSFGLSDDKWVCTACNLMSRDYYAEILNGTEYSERTGTEY